MFRRRFLRVGGDLNGELHGLLQRVARALIDGLDRLDVDARDDHVVLREDKALAHLAVLVDAKHRAADYARRVLNTTCHQ